MKTNPCRSAHPLASHSRPVPHRGMMFLLLLTLMVALSGGEARAQAEILISEGSNDLYTGINYDFGGVGVGTPVE